ncbi:MAG: quinol:cytochrome C oxidoreductase [Planctomycetes bacterium]|nr:quinol:cytochrome C oxidoreductase [Planctomycetota bacterium]
MTATANLTAPSLDQLAPSLTARVKQGDLVIPQMALLAIGVALLGGAYFTGDEHGSFWFSYLVGYMGVLGIVLCALFFTMVQHITRAGWSITVRRLAENLAWTLPWMLLLFAPVIAGSHTIYHHWMGADLTQDLVLKGKSAWLNQNAFFMRVGIYFLIWIVLAWFFRSKSIKQDDSGDPAISLRLSRVAAPGLLLFALSITFAAFDWIMSVDPHWFSTIFGVTYFAGGYMAFLAYTILLAMWLGRKGYLKEAITTEHYHDLGKFLFTFVVFWTYTNFSQYMLIYYANLPEETHWFADRAVNGWGAVGVILIVGHFLFPFVFLLSRHIKRNNKTLAFGSIFLLVIHCIDMQFLILPSGASHGEAHAGHGEAAGGHVDFGHEFGEYLHTISWADFGCFVGLIAIVTGLTIMNIRKSNLVPVRDPRLAESLHFQNF